MASSSNEKKKKREAEEALETLEHIRMIGEEVRDYPELLFWCPTCGLPGSRSTGEWQPCQNHPNRIVTCGLPACLRKVHHCCIKGIGCNHVLCEDCASSLRAFERCVQCWRLVCYDHSERVVIGDMSKRERICKKCNGE